jgi:hypothetical protein
MRLTVRRCFGSAGIQIPTAEVRFRSLSVEAECHVGDRMLPTLTNAALDAVDSMLGLVGASLGKTKTLHILKNVSGVVRPSRYVCTQTLNLTEFA